MMAKTNEEREKNYEVLLLTMQGLGADNLAKMIFRRVFLKCALDIKK